MATKSKSNRKTFSFSHAISDLAEFRKQARIVAKLKKHGRVLMDVGKVAEKARYMLPPGGSPWHEYAIGAPILAHLVPHPKIAPFVPAALVKKNLQAVRSRVQILNQLGLGATIRCIEPMLLPEAFFQKYPHLRGPRVDHPRRTTREEFAACTDLPEVLEMYEWMMAKLKKTVPMLEQFIIWTDDCGAGFCWADTLYNGPNGPRGCKGINMGDRVRGYLEALHSGAKKGGGDLKIVFSGNISASETEQIALRLPPNTRMSWPRAQPKTAGVGLPVEGTYPVLGFVNPMSLVNGAAQIGSAGIDTVVLHASPAYGRTTANALQIEKAVEVLLDCIRKPAKGLKGRLNKLEELSRKWGGAANADALFEAFVNLDRLVALKGAAAPGLGSLVHRITVRWFNRPLVIKPDLLTSEEEDYFLPHIFNVNREEARMDWLDTSGSRISAGALQFYWGDPRIRPLMGILKGMDRVAATLEGMKKAPAKKWLQELALSIRMWACVLRTGNNFCAAQIIRDRNKEALSSEPHFPSKTPTWMGNEDLLAFNNIMRDELDNTTTLLNLIKGGGLRLIARGKTQKDEDTFLLGPNVVATLEKKLEIMRRHWRDVEQYMATPFK